MASCTSSGTAGPHASGSALPSLVAPGASRALVVAVERAKHPGLWLYRVGADRRAVQVATVGPPPGRFFSAYGMTLSAGSSPVLCVVWSGDEPEGDGSGQESARCYAWGDRDGFALPVEGAVSDVALRDDGRAVAWTTSVNQGDEHTSHYDLVLADLDVGRTESRVTHQRTFVTQSEELPAGATALGCADTVGLGTWAGADRLLLQAWGENDFPGELFTHTATAPAAGSTPECRVIREPGHRVADGYNFFRSVAGGDASSFLAIEGQYCEITCSDHRQPAAPRAVRVDLRSGRVLDVVASPAAGRSIQLVSGGRDGVLYASVSQRSFNGMRVYLRWPGEKHGTLITGLPADLERVVAQP
jgi:hypothetical protein